MKMEIFVVLGSFATETETILVTIDRELAMSINYKNYPVYNKIDIEIWKDNQKVKEILVKI